MIAYFIHAPVIKILPLSSNPAFYSLCCVAATGTTDTIFPFITSCGVPPKGENRLRDRKREETHLSCLFALPLSIASAVYPHLFNNSNFQLSWPSPPQLDNAIPSQARAADAQGTSLLLLGSAIPAFFSFFSQSLGGYLLLKATMLTQCAHFVYLFSNSSLITFS